VSDKLRAKLALRLISIARRLLRMPTGGHDGNYDICIYCKAGGCEDGTAEHRADCPSVPGVWPVTLQEMWPAGPAQCEGCGTTLWPGDQYSHIVLSEAPPIFQVACTGCALLAEVEATT
jgi:hypothetical protein